MADSDKLLTSFNIFPSEKVYKDHQSELSDGDISIVPVDSNFLRGKSAFEAAVERGFEGNETEWIQSLKGEKGDKGDQGEKGDKGATVYDIAVEEGYPGSKSEWLLSLRGAPGESGSGLPIGFTYFSINPNIPSGSLPLFGGLYSREEYKDLWEYANSQPGFVIPEEKWQELFSSNEGNVPFYSYGDGTTTFRIPSLNCITKGSNDLDQIGSYIEAGLPNIEGTIFSRSRDNTYPGAIFNADGSFSLETKAFADPDTNWTYISVSSGAGNGDVVSFSARRSSSIYGKSDTVQPSSIIGIWLVKAYGILLNEGSLTIESMDARLSRLEGLLTTIQDGEELTY